MLLGIGSQVPTVLDARRSHQHAQGAVEVCRTVRSFAPVAAWEDLGIYGVFQQLPLDTLAEVAIPPGLQALLDAESDQWLVGTLETYLDAAGNVQESAKRLHIHRATLYYRLSRIEELTGLSLADGQDRLALHLGLKLGRLGRCDRHTHRHRWRRPLIRRSPQGRFVRRVTETSLRTTPRQAVS